MILELSSGESITITPAPGAVLSLETIPGGYTVRATEIPPPPESWELRWRFVDAAGNGSLAGWHTVNGYFNVHKPRDNSPSGTHYLQADRDWKGTDIWPPVNPTSDTAWVVTDEVTPHNKLTIGWEELHHMFKGTGRVSVLGYASQVMSVLVFSMPLQSPAITTKETPPQTYSFDVPIPPGGYKYYLVEIQVTLTDNRDGALIGDVWLRGE